YALKGVAAYKIDARNYLYVSGTYMNAAPTLDNTFISPRTSNKVIDDVHMEQMSSVEDGYLLRSRNINGRLSALLPEVKHGTEIQRFYHEDYRTFVNYVMQGVDIRTLGTELAVKAKISPALSATAVAAWTQAFYTSRPTASVYLDNDTSTR